MSNEVHPLMSVIEEWANNAPPPMVAFALNHEFQREIDLAALHDPLLGHDDAKREAWKTYRHASALGWALHGKPFGVEVHSMIYRAACGSNPLAFTLCDAAGDALVCGAKFFSAFSVASRLPGFRFALEVQAKYFEIDRKFHGAERLSYVYRGIIAKGHPGADFWLMACQRGFDSTQEFINAVALEKRLADDAERKRDTRDSPRAAAKYREKIACGWLPLSLWARTSKSIAYLLEPDLTDTDKETARVEKDISEFHKKVKVPSSHRGREYGEIIERAERAAKKYPWQSDA